MEEFNGKAELRKLMEEKGSEEIFVSAVRVLGAKKTAPRFLNQVFQPVYQASTVEELLQQAEKLDVRLSRFGNVYEQVVVGLDASKVRSDWVDVVVLLKEKPRLRASTGMEMGVGDGDGRGYANVEYRNVFGGAERLVLHYAKGTRTLGDYQVRLETPIKADPDRWFIVSGGQGWYDWQRTRSYDETCRSVRAEYLTRKGLGQWNLWYDLSWRRIHHLARAASLTTRRAAGDSMKSILGVGYQWDSRNDALLASTGRLFRLDLEASPSFVKGELELQSAGILSQREPRWSWSGKLVAGVVHGDAGPSDRFFLGGRSSVRGFLSEGIGPRDGRDAVGGRAMLSTGLSLFTPLPWFQTPWFRGHFFVNTGSCGDQPWKDQRVSVGAGVVYRHEMARLELSYGIPLLSGTQDRAKAGLCIALGMNFL